MDIGVFSPRFRPVGRSKVDGSQPHKKGNEDNKGPFHPEDPFQTKPTWRKIHVFNNCPLFDPCVPKFRDKE